MIRVAKKVFTCDFVNVKNSMLAAEPECSLSSINAIWSRCDRLLERGIWILGLGASRNVDLTEHDDIAQCKRVDLLLRFGGFEDCDSRSLFKDKKSKMTVKKARNYLRSRGRDDANEWLWSVDTSSAPNLQQC